ncbi:MULTISPECIES: phytochelatin synthase family protein [unclassified Coleofasciculus]|uniref:phytochelatin synthase family protein n=1 Tax=unclassified Coleofasciculus TaxID=2692782 RepID=UPI00187F02CD|nr:MULTISPECIES: phytochelatin synthase family protein [unclassified Coleofasciculus]MBE9127992.1 phytochelatin synthase family protein [Coleofasciculus sp. LEGE 07081]MBE9148177.1 phytochelatin synthase family protein [Coleofasciculus sp. LEGE 07092]
MNSRTYHIGLLKAIRIPLGAVVLGFCLATGRVLPQTLPLSETLIDLNSTEGETLLIESQARNDYLPLSIHFVTQDNLAYCGVASIVMVLNALSIPAPEASEFGTYRIFTQENFFSNAQTKQVLPAEVVSRQGMTLEQLSQLLESYPVQTKVFHGGDVTLEEFRNLAVKNLQEPDNFVLVNYLRKAIGQESGGHISPLAAYNEQTDRFLILDVSRYKYPPIWIQAEDLWQAMATVDSASGKTRGFVMVSPR